MYFLNYIFNFFLEPRQEIWVHFSLILCSITALLLADILGTAASSSLYSVTNAKSPKWPNSLAMIYAYCFGNGYCTEHFSIFPQTDSYFSISCEHLLHNHLSKKMQKHIYCLIWKITCASANLVSTTYVH